MRKSIYKINLFIICICLFFLVGCGDSTSTESSNESTSTISENEEGWHKKAGDTTGHDWIKMTDYQKEDIVKGMIDSAEGSGGKITKDSSWIINNLNDFYDKDVEDTLEVSLAEAFSMICVSGKAYEEGQ